MIETPSLNTVLTPTLLKQERSFNRFLNRCIMYFFSRLFSFHSFHFLSYLFFHDSIFVKISELAIYLSRQTSAMQPLEFYFCIYLIASYNYIPIFAKYLEETLGIKGKLPSLSPSFFFLESHCLLRK